MKSFNNNEICIATAASGAGVFYVIFYGGYRLPIMVSFIGCRCEQSVPVFYRFFVKILTISTELNVCMYLSRYIHVKSTP